MFDTNLTQFWNFMAKKPWHNSEKQKRKPIRLCWWQHNVKKSRNEEFHFGGSFSFNLTLRQSDFTWVYARWFYVRWDSTHMRSDWIKHWKILKKSKSSYNFTFSIWPYMGLISPRIKLSFAYCMINSSQNFREKQALNQSGSSVSHLF